LQLDARHALALGDEADFHFRLQRWIILPVGVDVPLQEQTGGRLPGQHAAPIARAPVLAALVPVASDARFNHGIHGVCLANLVVGKWPPASNLLGEASPSHVLRCVHANGFAHTIWIAANLVLVHLGFLLLAASCSAALLKALSASS